MKFLPLLALLVLPGCIGARINPDTEAAEVALSLPASTARVKTLERELVKAQEAAAQADQNLYAATKTLVEGAQTDLAGATARFEGAKAEARAEADAQVAEVERKIQDMDLLDLLPNQAADWVLALLGIGTVGAGGATVASRRRRGVGLLTGKPKAAATAGTSSAGTVKVGPPPA